MQDLSSRSPSPNQTEGSPSNRIPVARIPAKVYLLGFASLAGIIMLLWGVPRILALYNQRRGAQSLESITAKAQNEITVDFYCGNQTSLSDQEKEVLLRARARFNDALKYQSNLSQSYLRLARTDCLLKDYPEAIEAYQKYISFHPNNPLGHLELALAYEGSCGPEQPLTDSGAAATKPLSSISQLPCDDDVTNASIRKEWQASGETPQDLLDEGQAEEKRNHPTHAILWYQRALFIDPENNNAWQLIGKLCLYKSSTVDEQTCGLFTHRNLENLFVDARFDFPLTQQKFQVWNLFEYNKNTGYSTTACPGNIEVNCAFISIVGTPPTFGAGIYECFNLESGKTYQYSAWLKVTTYSNARWRPLYYQGDISGKPSGHWFGSGYQTGSTDWKYFEYTFIAPAFDQQRACFYPINLYGDGKSWIKSPVLKRVNEP